MSEFVRYWPVPQAYEFTGFLTLHPTDGLKLTAREPKASPGSRIAKIKLAVPKSFFETPSLTLTATVPEGQGGEITIDAEAAAEALEPVIGGKVRFEIEAPGDDQ
ncbi:MAG: hypothetical protein AAFR64_14075 [Pseudomonadota bacterium]